MVVLNDFGYLSVRLPSTYNFLLSCKHQLMLDLFGNPEQHITHNFTTCIPRLIDKLHPVGWRLQTSSGYEFYLSINPYMVIHNPWRN